MFKTHPNNIHGIKAAVKAHETVYFHGDGNIYHKKEDSDFRKDFSNDPTGSHTYRVKFGKGGKQVPSSLEELNKMLLAAKSEEAVESAKPKESSSVATFDVEIPDEKPAKEPKEPKEPKEQK